MFTSHEGLNLIKRCEGLRLTAYLCSAGVPTIGYGTTRIDGKPVKLGTKITQEQANSYLAIDLRKFEKAVESLVKVAINQEIFDALVSFVYNLGEGNLKSSTLLRLLNDQKYVEAAAEFKKWNKAGGKVLPGLTSRRAAEEALFRAGIEKLFE